MIWFALAALVTVWTGVWLYRYDSTSVGGAVSGAVATGFAAAIVAFFLNFIFALGAPVHPEGRFYCDLQAIGPAQIGGGSLFLGTGYIGSSPAYVYYCKDGVGFKAETIDVRNAWIIEDGAEKPHVNVNDPVATPRKWLSIWGSTDGAAYVTEFHVPPGSVESKFKVN